jgi:hypothetical protein
MKKLFLFLQLIKNMGWRYIVYRVKHIINTKLGILQKKHPLNPTSKFFMSLDEWKKNEYTFLFNEKDVQQLEKKKASSLEEKAQKILNGHIQYFSHQWIDLGLNYDWITNPDTNFKYNINIHWSKINDFDSSVGDIKYVWEKSRFSYLLTIIRYDHHFQKDNSAFVFNEIESWIEKNPINQGPNYKCSQEISLRLFNWLYAIHFYKNSPNLTENLWEKMQHVIYWQLHHVYHHINFSRIAVRNNHAITETLMLSLSEIFFPFIPETKLWSETGRKYFEQEIDYQIYNDGAFIQHSMNYHRVLIQLLNIGITITQKAKKPFSENVYKKAYKTLNFLYQFVQNENGYLPNYGANDGALFFPLSETQYRDYRPQLNTLHKILTGFDLFDNVNEDFFKLEKPIYHYEKLMFNQGITIFESGYYIIREKNQFAFIRCGGYKDRPSQADNLHLDFWIDGENILTDAGTYKYNTDKDIVNFFVGSKSHNTVIVNNQDQMLKGGRFIWYYWTQSNGATLTETKDSYVFEGKISAFRHINKNIIHSRKIVKLKNEFNFTINDKIVNFDRQCTQNWHINPKFALNFISKSDHETIIENYDSSLSNFYGQKQYQKGIKIKFIEEIITTITN